MGKSPSPGAWRKGDRAARGVFAGEDTVLRADLGENGGQTSEQMMVTRKGIGIRPDSG